MTPEELAVIRSRTSDTRGYYSGSSHKADAAALLAEVDRLRAGLEKLASEYDEIGQYRIPSYEEGCSIAEELRDLLSAEL